MSYITKRLREPSTWAGLGLLAHAIAAVLTDYRNPQGWAELLGAAGAIVRAEGER